MAETIIVGRPRRTDKGREGEKKPIPKEELEHSKSAKETEKTCPETKEGDKD
jgi:hypothetical protein